MARPARPAAELPRLVQIRVEPDGAALSCHYCQAGARIYGGNIAGEIVRFQDQHFACDPALTAADRQAATASGQPEPERRSPLPGRVGGQPDALPAQRQAKPAPRTRAALWESETHDG